jgi:glycosyltransferase involved in cell wall biosynthesis
MNINLILTIVTINLNNKIGLGRTISSVLDQVFREFEYIIIDGGSTDGSLELIQENAPTIDYWISEPDDGVYQAMNKGIRQAKGKYCLFLNSGDWLIDRNVLSIVFSQERTADILTGMCNISQNGEVVFLAKPETPLSLKSFVRNTLPHQATFIRRDLLEKYNYYSENYKIHSDYDFWIRSIILGNCSVENINIIIADYNMEGISSDVINNPNLQAEAIAILHKYFPERVINDYHNFLAYQEDMIILNWVRSKKKLYVLLVILYRIATKISRVLSTL